MVNNIRKNSTAHNGEIGSLDTASGYATNANPGPKQVFKYLVIYSYT